MKAFGIFLRAVLVLMVAVNAASGGPRDAEWEKVAEAQKKDQPKTEIELLGGIEKAAFAEEAWDEGARAMARRILLEGDIQGTPAAAVKSIDGAIDGAPEPARPVLRSISARWLFGYYMQNRWRFMQRSSTAEPPGEDLETWDLARVLSEIDRRLQASLADAGRLQRTPVAAFSEVIEKGALPEHYRPTMFDFLADAALDFYSLEEVAVSRPEDAFEVDANSPALGTMDEFLAWDPESEHQDSPRLRAIRILQSLLDFHRADEERSAFLLWDLERLRWARETAVGPEKDERLERALRAFIEANPDNPTIAAARLDLGQLLLTQKKTKEAHAVFLAGAEAFATHPFGKLCRNEVRNLEEKEISLTTESHWTPAGEPIRVDYRNVGKVWFRLYSLGFRGGKDTMRNDPLPEPKSWLPDLLKGDPVRAWSEELQDEKDFARRASWLDSPEDLPFGYHVLVASAREDFALENNAVQVVGLHLTRLAMSVKAVESGLEGTVVDAVTGTPQAGIEVGLWIGRGEGIRQKSVKTDDKGYFRVARNDRDSQFLAVAQRDLERAVARGWMGYWRQHRPDPEHVVLFTDRAIYRPGQTVHFKGIWCSADANKGKYRVLKGKAGTVVFRDPNGKELETLQVKSNERGSFAGTFTAPEGSVLGQCRIELVGVGATSLRVEEYKRPKFFTEVLPPDEPAALGKTVRVKARAEAYTGAAIDGAKVEWRVTRMTRFPAWLRFCWWYFPPNDPDEEIAHGTTETGVDGSVEIAFEARPDRGVPEDVEPTFDFLVTVDVTDTAGETRSATRTVSVAYTSLRASVSAADWLEAGKELEFKVRTESHDGEGRSAKGILKVHRLKEPERCPRPDWNQGDYYPQQTEDTKDRPSPDPDRWEPGEVVAEIEVSTDDKGEAVVKHSLDAGAYRLVFETKDAGGREVKGLLGIEVVDPAAEDFPTKTPFFTASPSWSVEPGGSFELLWASGHDKARAWVEWYRDGVLIKREWSGEGRTQQVFRLPVEESYRGGVTVKVSQVTMNRLHHLQRTVEVPWTNKQLKLSWEHIVSKLEPGAKETWTAVIAGPDGEAAAAEMVATLYDASLDAYVMHGFHDLSGRLRREQSGWERREFSSRRSRFDYRAAFTREERVGVGMLYPTYRSELMGRWGHVPSRRGGIAYGRGRMLGGMVARDAVLAESDAAMPMAMAAAPADAFADGGAGGVERKDVGVSREAGGGEAQPDLSQVALRKNLQETAFFFPQLTSGEDGTVRMSFTMPEALTKWRFLGMAHDAEMRSGLLEGETITAKDLMVQPNPPRFLREGDELWFTVKVTNQGEDEQSGVARLTLADARTDEDRTAALGIAEVEQSFTVPAKESRTLKWKLAVPDGQGFLKYRAVASSGTLSDGEEGWLPVLSRKILVTESLALPIRNAGTKEFDFTKLLESGSSDSLDSKFLDVQVVSQPAWYGVMALPYLMEFPHECAEQLFNRYYANALAQNIATSDPKIERVFEQWRGTDALDSPLTKNEDIKGLMLEETPWLRDAQGESAARRRVGLLFDENHMTRELEKALGKLVQMQLGDGMWPWFPGGRGNQYITLYITTGFARLRNLGVETDITPALKALPALDRELTEYYERLKKDGHLDQDNLSPWVAHHLYTRTYFLKDKQVASGDRVAFDYFVGQAREHWTSLGSRMSRAHAALALHRLGDKEVPQLVTRSLKEHAVTGEELGMYWKDSEGEGWWWWQAPIETQAMMIEAFREIDADARAVEDCQVWLIKQKQVQDWRTTKATADAVWALLMAGDNLLASDELLRISLGGTMIEPAKVEAGTGFYQHRFLGGDVKPELGKIELKKNDKGVSWASVHWQYLEDMAKVTPHEGTPLTLEKSLFLRKNTDKGPQLVPVEGPVEVGDELVTRVVLRNDRAMEFVHLKDYRGSGTEPVNVLSGYRWQDGFGYYEVTRDTAGHFFIDRLPPGTHVFETSVRVQHAGEYQTGIAEVRCMYAPEFNSHSGSVLIRVE